MTDTAPTAHAIRAPHPADAPATVHQAFVRASERWPDHPFLCVMPETAQAYGIAAGEITYAEARQRVEALCASYRHAGYGPGHRAGLLFENRPAFFLHWFALNALGVSVVPISPELRAAELEYLVGHAELALAVSLPSHHAALRGAAATAQRTLRIMGPDDTPPPAPSGPPNAGSEPGASTECALLYTSGTTGLPKGCILPNTYFLHAGRWYADIGGLARLGVGAERMLTPLPLVHMNAMAYSAMAMVTTGGCLIALDRFHPSTWWNTVRESRATVVHYLGVMPAILMKAPASPDDMRHAVRFGFGAGVERSLHQPFEERFGFPLLEAWAMTETGAGAVVIANQDPRFPGSHCFGTEEEDVQILLVDDAGEPVPTGHDGELLVRHAGADPRFGFFAGYLKDEAATRKAWDGGWFHTGDVVRRDEHGHLHFIDRKKNVIRRSGENISAVEVENVLTQHPAVRAVAVAAVPDEVRGDEVLACVVSSDAPSDDALRARAQELVTWCLTRLAYYKVPGYVAFMDALPLTATNKLQRGKIGNLAATLPGGARCIDTRDMKKRQGIAS